MDISLSRWVYEVIVTANVDFVLNVILWMEDINSQGAAGCPIAPNT